MNTDWISALEPLLRVVVPAAVSFCVARMESHATIRRTELNWDKQHAYSADAMMQTALSAAALCVHDDPLKYRDQALNCVAPLLCAYSGKLGASIENLYSAIVKRDWPTAEKLIPTVGKLYRRHGNIFLRLIDQWGSKQSTT